ncbi:MAG: hypothetical protein K0R02_588 [Rickettsiaceae bacterium]|jgi:dephospho-CoA kinase|nr:hypothetical protein [Rickettsiaceae bacterium]
MKIIGITGSIASGKTFASNFIESLGYDVFYCDKFVARLYENSDFLSKVKSLFPYIEPLTKQKIAEYIFTHEAERKKLEELIHPLVRQGLKEFIEQVTPKGRNLVFAEVPLLFEAGAEQLFDIIIAVTCDDKVREERALQREGMTNDKLQKILKTQLPDKEKIMRSDFVLHSNDNELVFKEKIHALIKELSNRERNHP